MKTYYVYILSNKSRRLYTGITSDLIARVRQHREKVNQGFTARYNFDKLVYYEKFSHPLTAIKREKQIKGWLREKKLKLVLESNPDWVDLSQEWEEDPSWKAIPEATPRLVRKGKAGES